MYTAEDRQRKNTDVQSMSFSGAGNQLDGRTCSKTHADSFSLESEWMLVRAGCLCLMNSQQQASTAAVLLVPRMSLS